MQRNRIWQLLLLLIIASATAWGQPAYQQRLDSLQKELIPDLRIAVFQVSVLTKPDGSLLVRGETDTPEVLALFVEEMQRAGIAVADSVVRLPDPALAAPWGLVCLSVINMRAEPRYSAEMVSQALMGTPVQILKKRGGWLLIQTPDRYLGWVDNDGVFLLKAGQLAQWQKADRRMVTETLTLVRQSPSRQAAVISDLVLGNLVVAVARKGRWTEIELPDQRKGYVETRTISRFSTFSNQQPDAGKIVETAASMTGFPYLWGGTSVKGVDCSGMVKIAFFMNGLIIPRDASQQAQVAPLPDTTGWRSFRPGDLLFFGPSPDRIIHVGLYAGNGRYVHASGKVKWNSTDPSAPDYLHEQNKNLVKVSRYLANLPSAGVVPVKNHPWYFDLSQNQ